MIIKKGVDTSTNPIFRSIRKEADKWCKERGYVLVWTSGREGTHDAGSLHYQGDAEDWDVTENGQGVDDSVLLALKQHLFRVIGELLFDAVVKKFIHIEFQPK